MRSRLNSGVLVLAFLLAACGSSDSGSDAGPSVDGGGPPPDGSCYVQGDCAEGLFCVYPLGACGGLGTCVSGSGDCSPGIEHCTCEGETRTDCEVLVQGLSVRTRGACP